MDAVVPFCPLCQTSFTNQYMTAFALACNHIVCSYCLGKHQPTDTHYRCYFDGCYTAVGSERLLQGLAEFLTTEFADVAMFTMGTQATKMDEVLRVRFNLFYDRSKIPCKTRNCPLAQTKCGYDHSGQFYKKTHCGFSGSCPNAGTCIFIHPGEVGHSEPLSVSSTLRPSQIVNAAMLQAYNGYPSPPNDSSYYQLQTIADYRLPQCVPEETMPVAWYCQNCEAPNYGQNFCSSCGCLCNYQA